MFSMKITDKCAEKAVKCVYFNSFFLNTTTAIFSVLGEINFLLVFLYIPVYLNC